MKKSNYYESNNTFNEETKITFVAPAKEVGVYAVYNCTNNKYYIGSSYKLSKRFFEHYSALFNGKHFSTTLQTEFDEDESKFIIFPIEYVSKEKLNLREKYYIRIFNSIEKGYNLIYQGGNYPKIKFYHSSGIEEFITPIQLINKYGLHRGNIYDIINGKRKSVKGWALTPSNAKRQEKGKIYDFYNVDTGKIELKVTQKYMVNKYGINSGAISNLVKGRRNKHQNWVCLNNWYYNENLNILSS